MKPDNCAYIAEMLRGRAIVARAHGEMLPGLADDLDAAAAAIEHGFREFRMAVHTGDSLWRLSPDDAKREVMRRLLIDVASKLAESIVLDPRLTRYTRHLADGTEAPPEAAGKRIHHHEISTSFLLGPTNGE